MVELVCAHGACGRRFLRKRKIVDARKRAGQTRHYCDECSCYDDPVWREELATAHDALAAPLRADLLRDLAPCGSPACTEAECAVKPGHCHRPGCELEAPKADRTDRRSHRVKGYRKLYCSAHCRAVHASGLRKAINEGLEQAARFRSGREDILTQTEVSRRLGVRVASLHWYRDHDLLRPVEQHVFGNRRLVAYLLADIEQFEASGWTPSRLTKDEMRRLFQLGHGRAKGRKQRGLAAALECGKLAIEKTYPHLNAGRVAPEIRRIIIERLMAEFIGKNTVYLLDGASRRRDDPCYRRGREAIMRRLRRANTELQAPELLALLG
jgi:hypothetical protein